MPSEKRIVGYLEDIDWELWNQAIKKYNMGESKLIQEIIHAWLFANKLQLMSKDGKEN